jgi:5-methylcytosine-specific restriction endonuclease McrA
MRDFARAFYLSREWSEARSLALARSHGLCERCLARGIVRPARVVHHVVPLSPANIHDSSVTLSLDNLMCVCMDCHALLHSKPSSPTRAGLAFDADGNLVCDGTQRR